MRHQEGFTVTELMVACTVGLLLVMAALAFLLSARIVFTTIDEQTALQDTGHIAMTIMERAVRQAGWKNWEHKELTSGDLSFSEPRIIGLDASSLRMAAAGIENPLKKTVHGSDVLAIRFMGSGRGVSGDGTMLNCAGFGVPGPEDPLSTAAGQGGSIFYVATDRTGEPELHCKYRGQGGWRSDAIARGVESFQVLYGIDTDADGVPNRYLNAEGIHQLDQESEPEEDSDNTSASYWDKVVAVRIALLIRGRSSLRSTESVARYELFGKEYAEMYGNTDPGTSIREAEFSPEVRKRVRKIFTAHIWLRNSAGPNDI